MKIENFISTMEKIFPSQTAMQGDRVGLQLQSNKSDIQRILIAFEVTPAVIAEAITLQADMIFAFHPLIFNPLLKITNDDRVGALVTQLIQNKISLYIAHTNFDSYKFGTSKLLADKLGLDTKAFLVPDRNLPDFGMGIIAEYKEPISEAELLKKVKSVCKSSIRFNTLGSDKLYKKIAIVGGSGFSFIGDVLANQCDAFITADCSYHKFHEIDGKLLLIDPGHYEMEQFVAEGIESAIKQEFEGELEISVSGTNTNPILYY